MRINDVESQLVSAYIDWSSFIGNPRGIRKGSIITWTDYIPRMLNHPVMASNVTTLADEGQYIFQINEDGSIIQLYYAYDKYGDELQSARLAYYSAMADNIVMKNLIKAYKYAVRLAELTETDAVLPDHDENLLIESAEVIEEETELRSLIDGPVSWLRIDYDPVHARGVLHHDCHMHLSTFPYSRLVVAGVPTLKQFIEFIMAFCYPEVYEKHRLDDEGQYINASHLEIINSGCVPLKDHNVFRQMAHMRIPIISEGRGW